MRHQDWNAVVETHIRAAGGDPRFVLKSMDGELEKIAGLIGTAANLAGRFMGSVGHAGTGVANAARRAAGWVGGLGTRAAGAAGGLRAGVEGMGRGLQLEYAAGKGGFQFAPGVVDKLRGSSAATGAFRGLDTAKQTALAGKFSAGAHIPAAGVPGMSAGMASIDSAVATASKKAANPLNRFISGAERTAARPAVPAGAPAAVPAAVPAPGPLAPAPAGAASTAAVQGGAVPGVVDDAAARAARVKAFTAKFPAPPATQAAAATPTDIAGAPLWDQGKAMWKSWTPGQQVGAVAGAAAVPALGAGLMMGGGGQRGNTTIIQR